MNLEKTKEFEKIINSSKNNPNIIALILFGSYAKNKQKENSDIDIAIIRKKNTMPHQFDELSFKNKQFDIVFFDRLPDIIKFNVFSEGKILIVNDSQMYKSIRRKFLHAFRDNYPYYQKNMKRMLENV